MNKLEDIYKKLPVSLQNIACSLEGWRINRQRFGGNFTELLQFAEIRSNWTQEQVLTYRNNRLIQFLKYCQRNIPFYSNYFKTNGLDYRDFKSIDEISVLPIMRKQVINENIDDFTADNFPKKDLIKMKTSGSTGSPLHFYSTKTAIRELWSIFWRYRRWHGIDLNTWGAYLIGRPVVPIENKKPPFWRVNVPGKQLLMSGLHLNRENSVYFLEELKKRRITWIYGYPSLIALLATYKIEEDYDLGFEMKWITANSENLLPIQENIIKRAFGVKPVQLYGMAEGVASISECPSGSLHVDEDASAVEFIKLDDNDGYKIVGTNFSNFGTAFLRYEINDVFQWSDNQCSCGRPGRIVTSIDGRHEDHIRLKDGSVITRISPIFTNASNIIEGQIIQKKIDELLVKIVKGKNYTDKDESRFLKDIHERTRGLVNIKIEYSEKIPRTANGKLRLVISQL